MGIIGQVVARRAGSSRADALLRQRSLRPLGVPARPAAFKGTTAFNGTTAVGAVTYSSRDAGRFDGLAPKIGPSGTGPAGGMYAAEVTPEWRMISATEIKRVAGLIEVGRMSPEVVGSPLAQAAAALASLRESVTDKTRLFGFEEAADFAGRVEDISRVLEYLQVVAAHAVERTRNEAQNAQTEGRHQ
jgi:hypothetical protein